MISEQTVIAAFCDKLAEYGIRLSDPSRLKLDGNWHRARVDGDRGTALNLSYKIYFDDRPAGFFEDHKRGVSGTFSVTNGQDLSPAEREAARQAWVSRQREREADQARRYAEAATRAKAAIQAATGDPAAHPYIQRKGITPKPGAVHMDADDRLMIPVYQDFGELASVQTISAEGDKLFLPGGKMAGSFHPVSGANRERVLVCEGYATGAALNQVTDHSVACAMSAGNLPAVIKTMQRRFPEREIVACVDNDWTTFERTGRNPGVDAVAGLSVRVLAPQFPEGADPGHTDWDDWLRGYGTPEALLALLDGAPGPEPDTIPGDPDMGNPMSAGEPPVFDDRMPDYAAEYEDRYEADYMPPPSLPIAVAEPVDKPMATVTPIRADLSMTVDPTTDDIPSRYSEDNLALAFSHHYADDLRYVHPWGRWLRWDGARWAMEETLEVFDLARRVCRYAGNQAMNDSDLTTDKAKEATRSRMGQANVVAAVERMARADRRHAATVSQWDADEWLLNTTAGVVDLRNGSIRQGARDAHMTKITQASPGGACPTWIKFLETSTNGDHELIRFLQRVCGYSLTGSTREHALFFVYGAGGNGKGTFLNTFQWIIGDYAKSAPADMFTERQNEAHKTELARLMGARLVTAQETEEGKRWAEAKIKMLTGGDPITANFMRQDMFEFIPQFKLIMTGNHKPGLRNVDEAIKRRLNLIPFTVNIPADQRDKTLAERLKAEAGGILQWAIEGCLEWQRAGLQPPEAVRAATDEYLEQQDVLGQWLADCCEAQPGFSARSSDLYKSFKAWAEAAGEYVLPQKRWGSAMDTRGFNSVRMTAGMFYTGVGIRTHMEENGL